MKSLVIAVLRSRLTLALSVFVITALMVGGAVYAAIPNKGIITGCYDKKGELRIVNSSKDCGRKETSLTWNQTGPQGQAATSQLVCVGCSSRDVLARLKRADFKNANLDFADIAQSELRDQDFSGSSMVNAVLMGTQLHNSNFSGVDLTNSDLRSSGFMGGNLSNINLTNADLTFTNFIGVNLSTAKLTNVIWSHTACPDQTNSDDNGGTCLGHLVP